jgi:REP element-mobilizing transposase RayT
MEENRDELTARSSGADQQVRQRFGAGDKIPQAIEDFHSYQRRLPHWRLSGSVYWVTWRVHPSRNDLSASARQTVFDGLLYFDGQRYKVHGLVVMNDHVHLIVEPMPGWELQKLVKSWKSYTARSINKAEGSTGPLWQDEYLDRIIRNEEEYYEKLNYLLNNPRKRWPDCIDYRWVYCPLLSRNTESQADLLVRPTTPSEPALP